MNVTVPLPDDFAARFGSATELGRRVLEALALDEYRTGRMTRAELQRLLGLPDGAELDGFLRAHGIAEGAAPAGSGQRDRDAAGSDLVARFRAFRTDKTLGGLDVLELIREGRR